MEEVDSYQRALNGNITWAESSGTTCLEKLVVAQHPELLWIGCSDSRVPETTITGLKPGEIFTHRNIGNIVSPERDASLDSVLLYALTHLPVKHIIVCGHTQCGAAKAALEEANFLPKTHPTEGIEVNGAEEMLHSWLTPLSDILVSNSKTRSDIEGTSDPQKRVEVLVEENVRQGIERLKAWLKARLEIKKPDGTIVHEMSPQLHGVTFHIEKREVNGREYYGTLKKIVGYCRIASSRTSTDSSDTIATI